MARPTFVRVKLENGSEATVADSFAKSHKLDVLDKPATDKTGRPLPAKHKTTVARKAAAGKPAPAGKNTNPSGDDPIKED